MKTIFEVENYIIKVCLDKKYSLSSSKLQKLLYISQIAFYSEYKRDLFDGTFEFVKEQGPINQEIADKYKSYKICILDFDSVNLEYNEKELIDKVLTVYGPINGKMLEELLTDESFTPILNEDE